ncbi:PLP-dependent aminotransferase family protein [uncultured Cetobacterium sp.]|uniref:aminotransferase-like domain-containing protein n=1 Tax=uncultured Cetobacterium sp. TaxID=527638 RepID=UPI00260CBBC0|nr:PLP-dependent aminotransferase family protein [uncultured Cetobacterium sp.]
MKTLFNDFKITDPNFVYIPLFAFLKKKIETKEIYKQLPSIRKVSSFLNISSNTVAKAYLELEKINYIEVYKGKGTFVNKSIFSNIHLKFDSIEHEDLNLITQNKIYFDFISSAPNLSFLPVKEIKKAINYILDRDLELSLINEGPLGNLELRTTIQKNLYKQNITSNINSIQILSGAQQGIDLISKTLAFSKDNIIVENPTYLGALSTFKKLNLNIIKIPLKADGIDIIELKKILLKFPIKFLYLMTNFQTPTGITLSLEKSKTLLLLAKTFNFYIIEDDSSSDLYYSNNPPHSLKSLDINNRVIYIKSFSKIFMPGFRLGFAIIPEQILNSFLNNKILSDSNTSTLYQKAFAYLLKEGLIERHMSSSRKSFKNIQALLIQELNKIDDIHFSIPCGGCSLWIKLPENISSKSLYNKLLLSGVGIVPGYNYSESFDNYIKLNFSRITKKEITEGIRHLKEAIEYFQFLNI